MSHYSVCVAIPKEKMEGKEITGWSIESILDDILEPYYENCNREEYMEFSDETESAQANYETEKTTVIKYPDGSIHGCYDPDFGKRFIVRNDKILEKINDESDKGIETERSRQMELLSGYPVKERYSFREYCEDFCGYAEHDGRWGYWNNPNAKWDWFSIGGRFSGEFLVDWKLKDCLTADAVCKDVKFKYADGARKGDIPWGEFMRKAREEAEKDFTRYKRAFDTRSTEGLGPVAAITAEGVKSWGVMLYKKGETLDEYLRRNGIAPDDRYMLNCYAFVDKSGSWHSSGNMLWFGMSADNKEERSWHEEVQASLSELDDEDFLVMVDCHI